MSNAQNGRVAILWRGGRLSPHQLRYRELYAALGVTIELVHTIADIDRLLG
jgi:hypothetical protein